MATNHTYVVKNSKTVFKLSMMMVCVSLGLVAMYLLTDEDPGIGMVLFIAALLVLPFGLAALWGKRYSIRVQGSTMTVQKSLRLKPCRVEMADITRAVYVISDTWAGTNVKLTVHTSVCGKFTVETLMVNGDRLQKLIEQSVSRDKIKTIQRSFAK